MTEIAIHRPPETGNTLQATSQSRSLLGLMQQAKQQYDLGSSAYKKAVEHAWHMGKFLCEAHAKHRELKKLKKKSAPTWKSLLEQFGISISSDYRTRRLFENCPDLEAITKLPIMEAYEKAGIPRTGSTKKPMTDANNKQHPSSDTQDEDDDVDEEQDDYDVDDDDLIDDRTYFDRLRDINCDFGLMCEHHQVEGLTIDEIDAVLSMVEQITDNAVDFQTYLLKQLAQSA